MEKFIISAEAFTITVAFLQITAHIVWFFVLCAREPSVLQLGGGGFQGVVEVLAKCIYEGSLEELIDGDAFSFSLCKGAAAERPAVKVECGHSAGEFGDADGVEAAGDGLFEGAFAQRAGSLNGAEATALLKKGIGALCSAYKGSHKVAILVFYGKALTFNLFHSF